MTATAVIKKITSFTSGSAAKMQGIWTPIWKVLNFNPSDDLISPKKNLSVSIEKGSLSAVYATRAFSRIMVRGVRDYPFSEGRYPQPDEVASSLVLAKNAFGFSRADVTLGIPKSWTIIRTAEFPSTVKEHLPAVVAYEMDRITPFTAEEAFFDFKVLKESGERLTVLVLAAKTEMITPYLDALKENGLTVERVTVNLAGMRTLCSYMDRGQNSIFVKVDEKEYEGALCRNGSLFSVFTHTFAGKDEDSKVERLSSEINSILGNTQTGGKTRIVAWFKDRSPSLKELFKLRLNMPLAVLGETDTRVRFSSTPPREVPHDAVGSMLESLWPKADGFNLLKKGVVAKHKTPVGLTLLLVFALLGMGALYTVQPLKVEQNRLKDIEVQIAPKKQEVKKIEALKKEAEALEVEIATIGQFKESRPSSLNIMKELTTIIPKTTWLTRLRITDTTVEIEGNSASATELLPKLEGSKLFRKAEFASPTFRDAKTAQERFNIKMEVEGSRKLDEMMKKDSKKPEDEAAGKGAAKAGAQSEKNGKK